MVGLVWLVICVVVVVVDVLTAMSRLLRSSTRLVDLVPWQRAAWMFLLLSTMGWMLSSGVRKDRPWE